MVNLVRHPNKITAPCSDGKPPDLEYADDVLLLSEEQNNLQVLLDCLNYKATTSGMHFAPSKYKMFQDWTGLKPDLVLERRNGTR